MHQMRDSIIGIHDSIHQMRNDINRLLLTSGFPAESILSPPRMPGACTRCRVFLQKCQFKSARGSCQKCLDVRHPCAVPPHPRLEHFNSDSTTSLEPQAVDLLTFSGDSDTSNAALLDLDTPSPDLVDWKVIGVSVISSASESIGCTTDFVSCLGSGEYDFSDRYGTGAGSGRTPSSSASEGNLSAASYRRSYSIYAPHFSSYSLVSFANHRGDRHLHLQGSTNH
ncbi:hypothetical protein C8J56DRAFT_206757 [Mycena floridula]|nr:hypothetical protein C8J56DRAFT_206757 [Mycena floridula]